MSTKIITHDECLDHVTPSGHPEQVARLEHVLKALAPLGLETLTAPLAPDDDLLRCHPQTHINALRAAVAARWLEPFGCGHPYVPWHADSGFEGGGWCASGGGYGDER